MEVILDESHDLLWMEDEDLPLVLGEISLMGVDDEVFECIRVESPGPVMSEWLITPASVNRQAGKA